MGAAHLRPQFPVRSRLCGGADAPPGASPPDPPPFLPHAEAPWQDADLVQGYWFAWTAFHSYTSVFVSPD